MKDVGKKVIDISGALQYFDAQEGVVEMIIGKTGMGKTYFATLRALKFLYNGYVVYTTWKLNIPDYYDEREHWWPVLRNMFRREKVFYRINLKENWKYVDLHSFDDPNTKIFDTEKFSHFLATRTDCIFMLDEGQDVFDSHSKSTKHARQSITRTRHMHKTLIIIAQRAQAVDVSARGNVEAFFRCEKRNIFGYNRFVVRRTEDIDDSNNYPIWVRHDSTGRVTWKAPVWYKGYGRKRIYQAYDSWYMRQQQIKSQDLKIDVFELSARDRWVAFYDLIFGKPKVKAELSTELSTPTPTPAPLETSEKKAKIKWYGSIFSWRKKPPHTQRREKKLLENALGFPSGGKKAESFGSTLDLRRN